MTESRASIGTVLVIDDDPQIRETIFLSLDGAGYRVIVAGSGEEGAAMALAENPDIILLDMMLPGMDGCATAMELAKDKKARNIPIVMMTGSLETADRLKALKAGAVDFLEKPVSGDELTAKVDSLVRLKAYHDEAQWQRDELLGELAGKTGQLEAALAAFSRFVPGEFLACLSKKSILDISLGDHVQADMSIMFADIRSFTALSEKMTPQENFSFMNSYLGRMNPFIWEHGGYIDKYIGDAIMALFPKGPDTALDASIAMLRHIPVYNVHRARCGYAPIAIGIGVNSGTVMLGIIGHERFMQGTVISDAVNLASRLEALTKVYGVSLVVSRYVLFTLDKPERYHYRFLDNVALKGKSESIPVYEVFDADPPRLFDQKAATKESFEKAVYEYHAKRFLEALAIFDALSAEKEPDTAVSIYRKRCRAVLCGK
jgi:two-component system sensor histidine kinase ChiS